LLTEVQGLLTASASSAGLSQEEKEANQLQIDSILQTIDRISSATDFQGVKLLNGNFDYQVTGVGTGVSDFSINGAKFETPTQDVSAIVTQSAQQAGLFLELGANGSGEINLGTGSSFSIEISGAAGSRELSFASGQTIATIAAAINSFSDVTGVTATTSGSGIVLGSQDFGSSEFVSVKVVDDGNITDNTGSSTTLGVFQLESDDFNTAQSTGTSFANASNPVRDNGQNIAGTINGIVATGNGNTLSINTDFLDVSATLSTDSNVGGNAISLGQKSLFTITGGGADFQLAGNVDVAGKVSIGIADISTRKLGRSDLGFLDDLGSGKAFAVTNSDANFSEAQSIVDQAIKSVSSSRGRLGAFQKNVVGATIRSLGIAIENTQAAESVIRDADFATETASLTRNQILVQASTNSLALANQSPQSVLSLLG
ncbi:MAG: flagellin, partial [Planctomycetota bacterium]